LKIYFGLGSSKIQGGELAKVRSLAKLLAGYGKAISITVSGFAQPTPGSEKSDLALSASRARAVADLLRASGVTTKIVYLGAGRAKANIPTSRYVQIVATNSK
jgi:outer membrane protein OmpA-like peptidoglycan-associated protein